MKLEKDAIVCGMPAKLARDMVVRISTTGGEDFDHEDVTRAILHFTVKERFHDEQDYKNAQREAKALLSLLIADGYVEKGPTPKVFKLTANGEELARVKFVKRMTRAAALALLEGFLERVEQINQTAAEYTHVVAAVYLYGSLLNSDTSDVGDVDLVVGLAPRPGHRGYKDHVAHSLARAKASGRVLDYMKQLFFGPNEVMQILKARKAYISLEGFDISQIDQIAEKRLIVSDGVILRNAIPVA